MFSRNFLSILIFSFLAFRCFAQYLVHSDDVELPPEAMEQKPEYDFEELKDFYLRKPTMKFPDDIEYFTCPNGCESIDQLMIDYARIMSSDNETEKLEKAEEAEEIKKKVQRIYPKFGTPEYEPEERTVFRNTRRWV